MQTFRLAALLAASCAAGAAQAELDPATMIRLSASIVKIEATAPAGFSLGTGVIVAPDKVATNCHVTRRALRVYVLQRGLRRAASAQSSDVGHDLCVLRVEGLEGRSAPLAAPADSAEPVREGDRLLAVGFSGGTELRMSEGRLVSKVAVEGGTLLRSSTSFGSGASGGGLFDESGRLLGLLTFRLSGADDHYFSIPSTWIAAQVADETRYQPIAPLAGKAFWEQPGAAFLEGQPASGAAVPIGSALDSPSAPASAPEPISRAEQLVFLDPHLAEIKPPQTLRYQVVDEDAAGGRWADNASIKLSASPGGRCCVAEGQFPTAGGVLQLPEVVEASANPIVLYFLEREVRQLEARNKGKALYFQRRIRLALAESATVSETTAQWKGKTVPATQVTIQPFKNDPNQARFMRDSATEYTFVLSPEVPGRVLQMRATLPAVQPPVRRSVTLDGAAAKP